MQSRTRREEQKRDFTLVAGSPSLFALCGFFGSIFNFWLDNEVIRALRKAAGSLDWGVQQNVSVTSLSLLCVTTH